MEQYSQQLTPDAEPDRDAAREPLKETLRRLAELLANSDMQALAVHASLPRATGQAHNTTTAALDQAMTELDFTQAQVHCLALLEQLDE